jgi:hypothetical protein
MMEYRDIEYAVVQGIGRHLWKWSASVADVVITGQAHSKWALNWNVERVFNPDRKDPHWGRRKLARDR